MIYEWTAKRPPADDTIERAVRAVRSFLDAAPDGDVAGRAVVVAELERLEAQIARGTSSASGLRLARALVAWVGRTDAAAWDTATRH
jgi:hypothetical protein